MPTTAIREKKEGLTDQTLGQLQTFIQNLKKGTISPFKEKTERARKNLKKAGLIK
jgi:hypothetical protein